MTCTKIGPLLSASIDGETSPEEELLVKEHCARCPSCAALYARLGETEALLAHRQNGGPLPAFEARVFERIHQRDQAAHPFLDFIGIEKKCIVAFGALLLVISALAYQSAVLAPTAAYQDLQEYLAGSTVQVAAAHEAAAYVVEGSY